MIIRANRQRLLTFMAGLFACLAFVILAWVVVVSASGLKYDPGTGRFQKTVIVAVEPVIPEVKLTINDQLVATELPFELRDQLPGLYTVKIEKDGYYPWVQNWQLSAGQVGLVDNDTTLIARKPQVEDVATVISSQFVTTFDVGLVLTDVGELLDQGRQVTTFATRPVQAHRLHTGYLYQVGRELRLFFPIGNQDYLLYTLASDQVAKLTTNSPNWQVTVDDAGATKLIHLTEPTLR